MREAPISFHAFSLWEIDMRRASEGGPYKAGWQATDVARLANSAPPSAALLHLLQKNASGSIASRGDATVYSMPKSRVVVGESRELVFESLRHERGFLCV